MWTYYPQYGILLPVPIRVPICQKGAQTSLRARHLRTDTQEMSPSPLPSTHSSILPSHAKIVVGDDPTTVSIIFKDMIERSGLSTAEVARRMGTAAQHIQQYSLGYRLNPGLRLTAALARACGGRLVVEFPQSPLA